MKSIRRIALSALLTVGAFTAITYTACTKDACKSVTCQNQGTCVNGSCSCPTGYEGTSCQVLSRDKFIGTYDGTEACTSGNDHYTITIAANSDNLKLTLSNLYNEGFTAICTMTGTNTFSFSGNQIGTVTTTFSGTGTLTGNTLTVAYAISNGTVSNNCTFTGTK